MTGFVARLEAALALELPYEGRAARSGGNPAAVLALFGRAREGAGEYRLLLTRRTETVETHKGQMAFPGGMCELGELCDLAALRETEEEVGIPRERIRVLGALPEVLTATGFTIAPFVGILEGAPVEEIALRINAAEVAEAAWIPLSELMAPETYRKEFIRVGAINYPIHVYQVRSYRIWGATAAIIKNLLDRLAALG